MMKTTFALLFLFVSIGCVDEIEDFKPSDVVGGDGQECYDNDTCNAGFVCVAGACEAVTAANGDAGVANPPTFDAGAVTVGVDAGAPVL